MQIIKRLKNSQIIAVAAALTITLVLVACGKQNNEADRDAKTSSAVEESQDQDNTGHAPQGAKPGSHEDWCAGHQVPESLCTRCNSSLIPAFKASGDWCGGHGLPESQCLICNPDLKIVRPPKSNEKPQ